MTALTLVATPDPAPQADCIDCAGHGYRRTPLFGRFALEDSDSVECRTCNGTGVVNADSLSECADGCGAAFWLGTGCSHSLQLCPGCSGQCRYCVDEAREDAAYEALRDVLRGAV